MVDATLIASERKTVMLKGLHLFEFWDADAFLTDKRLLVTRTSPWIDFSTKEELGTKIEVVIVEDNTDYGDLEINNLFEKVTIKTKKKNISIPIKSEIKISDAVGVLYGDYRNQLSLKADGIKLVAKPTAE